MKWEKMKLSFTEWDDSGRVRSFYCHSVRMQRHWWTNQIKIIYVDTEFKAQPVLFRVGGCSHPAAPQHNRSAWLCVFWCGFEQEKGGQETPSHRCLGFPQCSWFAPRHVDLTAHTNKTVATCSSQCDLRVRSQKRNHRCQLTPYAVALSSKEKKFAGGRFKTSDFIFLPVLNKQRRVCGVPANRWSRAVWQQWSNESQYRYTFCHQRFRVREPFFLQTSVQPFLLTHIWDIQGSILTFFFPPNIW